VLDEYSNHHNKDDSVEEQDDKYGTQEGSKEYSNIRDEAAGEKVLHVLEQLI